MSRLVTLSAITFAAFIPLALSACSKVELPSHEPEDAFTRVKATLCDKQVALLGEGPNHGEGTTVAFKAKLTQALIEECGFSLLLFESSFYEFAKMNTDILAGRTIERKDLDAAIGFLWRDEAEIEPLMAFAQTAINQGMLTIGGLDDQVGGRGQDYANFVMPKEITESLNEARKDDCRAALNQRITYSFPNDDPYNVAKKHFILSCLNTLVKDRSDAEPYDPQAAMTHSLYRMVHRDLDPRRIKIVGRERSMYKNFEYWYNVADNKPRTIIWSSTVHAAKSGSVLKLLDNDPHLGALINKRFEGAAYVVGFSSLTGRHALMGRGIEDLAVAPENSIEAITFEDADEDVAFVSTDELERFGSVSAAAINNTYQVRDWVDVLDGIIIFREQKPPTKATEKPQ